MSTQCDEQQAAGLATRDGWIRIRGARVHNLQNLDLDIPRRRLVVLTGPSGSGKSSLAFDTIYAEGQRQYLESLSVYARQFLHQMERPDVDSIEGLQPTICIDQRPGNQNPRSTVATVTEIYDYLRVLMARLGQPQCYQCGEPIRQQTAEQIQQRLMELPEGTKLMVLAPLVRGRRGRHQDVVARIRKARLIRARVDGEVVDIDRFPELEPRKPHHIEAVVDRIIIRPAIRARLAESLQLALRFGDGIAIGCYYEESSGGTGSWRDELFNTLYACPRCHVSYEELEPRTFSFNSPYGACPDCEGLGWRVEFDRELVIPDLSLSLSGDAIAPWSGPGTAATRKFQDQLAGFLSARDLGPDTPLDRLRPPVFQQFLRGTGDGSRFLGLLRMLEKEYATTTSAARKEKLESFRGRVLCPSCGGSRLRPEASSVRLANRTIHEIAAMTIAGARRFCRGLAFDGPEARVAQPLLGEIATRLEFLQKVGLDYLTLDRSADTLSGGELQRVRLATSIGSGLVGVCYVLDEPSIGLHPRDNRRLIDALRDLQRQGNTVLVVEHDETTMRESDYLIDIGPGAGTGGGRVVAAGPPDDVIGSAESITGRYLRRELRIEVPAGRRRTARSRSIVIEKAATNNLKQIDARFPLGALVCVTGVSGSGKSSLVNETLVRAVVRRLGGNAPKPGPHASLRGVSQIDKMIEIDQAPIGRSPRSNAATYTGVFDEVRKVFARTRDAKARGFRASRFSFNVKGGRCDECQGQGTRKIEMNFLPDLYVTCDECHGARFNRQTLLVRYRGHSIAAVLDMSVDAAAAFFENMPQIHRLLTSLQDVGLGYLPLGQPSTTLSGGEAQRIKLATELARVDTGKTLYVLDEPTTGLHFDDIRKLLDVLGRLVDRGNTVVVIEHHLDVVKCADWIIDLGPEGGEAGGQIVAEGTPEQVAGVDASFTGRCLRALLDGPSKGSSADDDTGE